MGAGDPRAPRARSQLSSDLLPWLRDRGRNNLGRIDENHSRAKGEPAWKGL